MDFGDSILGDVVKDDHPQIAKPRVEIHWEKVKSALDEALVILAGRYKANINSTRQYDQSYARSIELFGRGLRHLSENLDNKLSGFDGDIDLITAESKLKVPYNTDQGPHLVIRTGNVIIEHDPRFDNNIEIYDLGPYAIIIPLVKERFEPKVHWIPVWSPREDLRHPHHYVIRGEPSTCLGSFATPMDVMWGRGHLLEFAKLCVDFVHIYNQSSPLVRVESLPHKRLIRQERRRRRSRYKK